MRLTEANGAGALRVSEVDVALLLQAKAAIGAGIEILLETAGIRAADLGRVYLAGGFGMHLDVVHAIAVGLLPGFRVEQVRVVGQHLARRRAGWRWWIATRSKPWKNSASRSGLSN